MTPKAFDLLVLLLRQSGRVLRKSELINEVWPGTFVEEGSLAVNIFALRKALGRSVVGQSYIQTIPKRGYRFVATVRIVSDTSHSVHHEPPRKSAVTIAVLPMRNLTGDSDMEHISDGFTETIISQLACADLCQLSVIAHTSVMTYKNGSKTIGEIAAELHIEFAIESSLRVAGDRLLIAVHLVRADQQTRIWTRKYNRERRDLAMVQNEIGNAIADEIRISM